MGCMGDENWKKKNNVRKNRAIAVGDKESLWGGEHYLNCQNMEKGGNIMKLVKRGWRKEKIVSQNFWWFTPHF